MKKSSILLLLIIWFGFSAVYGQKAFDDLAIEITNYLNDKEGTYAVWFEHMQKEEAYFSINPDDMFHAASTMKTPVMVELFRRAELGEFNLADSIKVENRFYSIVDGSEFQLELDPEGDDPFERKVGEMATLYDLNHAMITYSSNITTNLILQLVGAEETTQTMRKLGAENIEVIRGLYDMEAFNRGLSNRTSARDLGIMFRHIASGTAVSPEMDSLMVEVLKDQFYRDVIPAKLPDDVVTATKSGFITGVIHDSGIVYLPDGQSYILIFLSKDLPDAAIGREAGAEVSRMIYEHFSN
ncbi:MAG: serine hydrolase [Balneolaceae bacterium]|nr:MAG: serine hydrolase [Balneolaceae bacterium]